MLPLGHRETIFSHVDQCLHRNFVLVTTITWGALWFQTLLRVHVKENRHDFQERRNKFSHDGALAVKPCPESLEGIFVLQIFRSWLDKVLNKLDLT